MDKQTKGEQQGGSEIRPLAKYSPDIRTLKSVKMPTFHFGMLAQAFSLGILGRLNSPFAAYPGFSMTYFTDRRRDERRPEEGQTSGAVYSPVLKMNFQFILNQLEREKASWQDEERNKRDRNQDADFHREPQRAGETENVRERQESTEEFLEHEVRLRHIEEIERIERIIQSAVRMQDASMPSEGGVSFPPENTEFHPPLDPLLKRRVAELQMRQLYEKNMPQTLQRDEFLNELRYLQDRSGEEVTVPSGMEEVHQNILRNVVENVAAAQIRTMPMATLLYRTEEERFHKADNAQRMEDMRQIYEKNMPQTLRRSEYLNELRYLQNGNNEEVAVPSRREEIYQNLVLDVIETAAAAQIRTMPISTLLYQTEEKRFHKADNAQRVEEMRQFYEKNMPQTLQHSEYFNELRYVQDSNVPELEVPGKREEIHRNILRDVVENVTAAQIRSLPVTTILHETEEERFHPASNAQRLEEMRQIYEKNMPQSLQREEIWQVLEKSISQDLQNDVPRTWQSYQDLSELRYLRNLNTKEIEVPRGREEVHRNILRDVIENVTAAQIRSLPIVTILHETEEERFHPADNAKRLEEMRQIYEKNMPQSLRHEEMQQILERNVSQVWQDAETLYELRYLQNVNAEEVELPRRTEEVHRNVLRDVIENITAAQVRSLPIASILHETEEERFHGADNAQRLEAMRQIYERNMPQHLQRNEYLSELRYLRDSNGTEVEVPGGTEEIHRNLLRSVVENVAEGYLRVSPIATVLHEMEEERHLKADGAKRQAEMRRIYEKNMPQTLRRDEYINELRYRSGQERAEEVEVPIGTEDVYRNIVREIIEETEHVDLIQKLVRKEPKTEEMHEVSVLKRFGAPTPVLLRDETPTERPVDMVYVRRRERNREEVEEKNDSSSNTPPPIQTDWDDDVPEWARNFFDQAAAQEASADRVERSQVFRRIREKIANAHAAANYWSDPSESRVSQFGDPDFLPPEDLQFKQAQPTGPQKPMTPEPVYLSESEIQRAADRVYRILEERIREERRRSGF